MYLLGFDIGSSSIKAALVDAQSQKPVKVVQYPETEMDIISRQTGWAEQQPEIWWDNVCHATRKLLELSGVDPNDIKSIGIAYQMHGLVLIDSDHRVLRPSIIWCDSRAVEIGQQAFEQLGEQQCLQHLLNSPGNFTASKLKWVKDNEPAIFDRIYKIMLPGDYIAMKFSGEVRTTMSGLSEGMLWDFKDNQVADFLLDYFGATSDCIPELVGTFEEQGRLSSEAAGQLGLPAGIPVGYRAGDQPNNALSLNVMKPGEVAATGGTSGVVYGVVDQPVFDPQLRVNSFAHVNHTVNNPSIGVLLCINGAGIQYSYMKQQLGGEETSYQDIERMITSVPVNSDGLRVIPFGNGAERVLGNRNIGSHIINLQLNRHHKGHFYRAALEGIAFSFAYGMEVLQQMGLSVNVIKVGNDNLFQSKVFSSTVSAIMDSEIQVVETTGAIGAAQASGIAAGIYSSVDQALGETKILEVHRSNQLNGSCTEGYKMWKNDLSKILNENI
jgi:xylulokinase